MLNVWFTPRRRSALVAAVLALACSHEAPKPTAQDRAAQAENDAEEQRAADRAAADKLAAQQAAAQALALHEAQVKLDAAVAALPPAPPLPPAPAFLGDSESPPENKATPERVSLGQQLFFDRRLSKDGSMSCESCHHPAQAFTSGSALDAKVGGAPNTRNAPTVLNLAYHQAGFYWDGRKPTLETVSQAAWSGQLGGDPLINPAVLNLIPSYRALFQRAFGGEATAQNIPLALAAFLRALKSGDSPWDNFEKGEKKAVSQAAQAGFKLFSEKGCALCHAPPLYSDTRFHVVGIGWDANKKAFADHGRMDASKDPADDGKFKTPSLRDAARTGPYFHDGSVQTLAEAIALMAAGGVKNPHLDPKLHRVKLSAREKAALQAFIESLSGNVALAGTPVLPE